MDPVPIPPHCLVSVSAEDLQHASYSEPPRCRLQTDGRAIAAPGPRGCRPAEPSLHRIPRYVGDGRIEVRLRLDRLGEEAVPDEMPVPPMPAIHPASVVSV